jgi:hypothetical protein
LNTLQQQLFVVYFTPQKPLNDRCFFCTGLWISRGKRHHFDTVHNGLAAKYERAITALRAANPTPYQLELCKTWENNISWGREEFDGVSTVVCEEKLGSHEESEEEQEVEEEKATLPAPSDDIAGPSAPKRAKVDGRKRDVAKIRERTDVPLYEQYGQEWYVSSESDSD